MAVILVEDAGGLDPRRIVVLFALMRALPTALLTVSLLVAAGGAATAVAKASAPSSVKGCVNKKDQLGVPSNGHCAKGFSPITLAVRGPKGATGAAGVHGVQGIQGVPGPQGPGAESSYLHSTTNTHSTPLTTSLAVPGTGVSFTSTCAITYDSSAFARLDIKSGAGYIEGSETGTFGGSGSAQLDAGSPFAAGADTIATNTTGDAFLYVYAGNQDGIVTLDLDVIDTTTAKPTIVSMKATVISEQGECLAVVTATPSANAGT